MGGEVAICIRRKGKQSARVLSKHALNHIASEPFFRFEGPFWQAWNKECAQPIAPCGYGLVAVDFDQRWIGSSQSYTSHEMDWVNLSQGAVAEDHLAELWAAGRLVGIDREGPFKRGSFSSVLAQIKAFQKRCQHMSSICLNVSLPKEWVLNDYEENNTGWLSFAQDMMQRTWRFSEKDAAAWIEYGCDRELSLSNLSFIASDLRARQLEQATPKASAKKPPSRF